MQGWVRLIGGWCISHVLETFRGHGNCITLTTHVCSMRQRLFPPFSVTACTYRYYSTCTTVDVWYLFPPLSVRKSESLPELPKWIYGFAARKRLPEWHVGVMMWTTATTVGS
jgi:hypothetical protein